MNIYLQLIELKWSHEMLCVYLCKMRSGLQVLARSNKDKIFQMSAKNDECNLMLLCVGYSVTLVCLFVVQYQTENAIVHADDDYGE